MGRCVQRVLFSQIQPVHPLCRHRRSGLVRQQFNRIVDALAVPVGLRRFGLSVHPVEQSQGGYRLDPGGRVPGVDHAVVFRHIVRKRGKRLAGQRSGRQPGFQRPLVEPVLGCRTRGKHPSPGAGFPRFLLFVSGQKQITRRQSVRRPRVLFHLRIGEYPALRRHVSEPIEIVQADFRQHHPRFVVHVRLQHEGGGGHIRDGPAALALREEPPAPFPPLGAPGPRHTQPRGRPQAFLRARVVRETKVSDGLDDDLPGGCRSTVP